MALVVSITLLVAIFLLIMVPIVTILISDKPTNRNDYLVLVNKTHQLPADWESRITLVKSQDPWGDDVIIEQRTLEQFEKLQKALLEQGVDIRLDSVYRSVKDQKELWAYFEQEYGEDYCREYVAMPGHSEHHTGLAVDVCMMIDGEPDNDNDHMIANTALFAKVHVLMPKYGFILRYMEGKENITGYSYEPWHLRFVGDPEIAVEITEKGLTLEEYLGETAH